MPHVLCKPAIVSDLLRRAGLRRILARYFAVAPRRLGLIYNAFGKPQIAGSNRRQLHFNLSHTETTAMLAVSDHYHVGIDIETIRPLKEDIAGHFFAEGIQDPEDAGPRGISSRLLSPLDREGSVPEGPRRRIVAAA